jgi:hypothetical protein
LRLLAQLVTAAAEPIASRGSALGACQSARDRCHEVHARVRQRKTARREGVPIEKETGERERIREVGNGCWFRIRLQENRQAHELVTIRFAGCTRNGAA